MGLLPSSSHFSKTERALDKHATQRLDASDLYVCGNGYRTMIKTRLNLLAYLLQA
jgi:hypothetical protein